MQAKQSTTETPSAEAVQLWREGRLDEAIALLYEALGDDFGNDDIIGVLAPMLAEAQQFERADRLFERALQAPHPSGELRLNYATFLCHSGRPALALPHFAAASSAFHRDLKSSVAAGFRQAAGDAIGMLAFCDCNLAKALGALGNYEMALVLVEPWLTDERVWERASTIAGGALEALGRDVHAAFATWHAERRAAPWMVVVLGEVAAMNTGDDVDAFVVFVEGSAYLGFDWVAGLDSPILSRFRACCHPSNLDLAMAVAQSSPAFVDWDFATVGAAEAIWPATLAAQQVAEAQSARLALRVGDAFLREDVCSCDGTVEGLSD